MGKNNTVNVRDYYKGLSKLEKGQFLAYLLKRYDYKTSTISGKLRENNVSRLRADELENIQKTIKTGVWRT